MQQLRQLWRMIALAVLLLGSAACGGPSANSPTPTTTAITPPTASVAQVTSPATHEPVTAEASTLAVPASPSATLAPSTSASAIPQAPGSGQRAKTSGCVARGSLPDAACTPGAVFADATATQICAPGYASRVRDVPQSEKDQVYAAYGIRSHRAGEYEVDHLISLELGGSNEIANLWPEAASPTPGFHEKDRVENYLHDQVCSGKLPLRQAQVEIATNWLAVYQRISGATISPVTPPTPLLPTLVPTAAPSAAATSVAAPLQVTFVSVVGGRPGSHARVGIQTTPGAQCAITYVTPAGTVSRAAGLVPESADASGRATWSWIIGTRTNPGTGTVMVECNGVSARTDIPIG